MELEKVAVAGSFLDHLGCYAACVGQELSLIAKQSHLGSAKTVEINFAVHLTLTQKNQLKLWLLVRIYW